MSAIAVWKFIIQLMLESQWNVSTLTPLIIATALKWIKFGKRSYHILSSRYVSLGKRLQSLQQWTKLMHFNDAYKTTAKTWHWTKRRENKTFLSEWFLLVDVSIAFLHLFDSHHQFSKFTTHSQHSSPKISAPKFCCSCSGFPSVAVVFFLASAMIFT